MEEIEKKIDEVVEALIETNPVDEAKKVLEETKNILEETRKERIRIEKATAEMLVNGRSYAGQSQPKAETADEKWEREAKLRYAGTGMDPTPSVKI
jgi:formate-dependent nitrite reductase cytochrome c552 subunit